MPIETKLVAKVVEALVEKGVRKSFDKKLPGKKENISILLTVGKPNHAERLFIKRCLKNKLGFPTGMYLAEFPAKKKK